MDSETSKQILEELQEIDVTLRTFLYYFDSVVKDAKDAKEQTDNILRAWSQMK